MLLRSWVSCDTLRPRYSVRTAALDVRNLSEISATVAAFSGLAMALLSGSSSRSAPRHDERPGAGARGVRNGCRTRTPEGTQPRRAGRRPGRRQLSVAHLRGPPAAAGPSTTLAGGDRRSLADDKGTGPVGGVQIVRSPAGETAQGSAGEIDGVAAG